MASVVDVMNRALSRIGAATINAPTDENESARQASAAWEFVRKEVLREHPWNSAGARAALPALSDAPAFGFLFQYQWPADCLRVRSVVDADGEDTGEDWTVEGRVVLTDVAAPLRVRYTRDETDVGVWDPILVSAVAARLAVELSRKIDGNRADRQELKGDYETLLARARRADAQEQSPSELDEDDWIRVRL